MKISSLLDARGDEDVFVSFEYFPPRTPEGVTALYERIGKMKAYGKDETRRCM
jgi:5,10-methylenetetrahydrofolate reductase